MKRRKTLLSLPPCRSAARVFRINPDPDRPHVVEVRIARTRRQMRAEIARLDGDHGIERECMGLVRHWKAIVGGRCVVRPGRLIARMYLNRADLRSDGNEIISHECTHAGMAWARLQKANLKRMVGEEVLCYATGRMVRQLASIGHMIGIW